MSLREMTLTLPFQSWTRAPRASSLVHWSGVSSGKRALASVHVEVDADVESCGGAGDEEEGGGEEGGASSES